MTRGSVIFPQTSAKMKRLPRRHRIAHLRALIRQAPSPSIRRFELASLLREEIADQSSEVGAP